MILSCWSSSGLDEGLSGSWSGFGVEISSSPPGVGVAEPNSISKVARFSGTPEQNPEQNSEQKPEQNL